MLFFCIFPPWECTSGGGHLLCVWGSDVVFMRISNAGMHASVGPDVVFYEYFLRGNAFLVEDTCSVYGAQSCFYS